MTGGVGAPMPTVTTGPLRAFHSKLLVITPLHKCFRLPSYGHRAQTTVETRLLALPEHEAALTSAASSRCIALRPRCRSAAISLWSQRLLKVLNTNAELLLLLPPASAPGSHLTVLPAAASSCVQALAEAVNSAPPSQRAELLRVHIGPSLMSLIVFVMPASASAPSDSFHSQCGTPFLLRSSAPALSVSVVG
jgi:hypothetical protein